MASGLRSGGSTARLNRSRTDEQASDGGGKMRRRGPLFQDETALVGVQEDLIALSVVLITFSLFIAAIFNSLLWADAVDERIEFTEIAPRVASELALDEQLRYQAGEPGVLEIGSLAIFAESQCSGVDCENNRTQFLLHHALHELHYNITIGVTAHPNDGPLSTGLLDSEVVFRSVSWGEAPSGSEGVQEAEQVHSARRVVNIVDAQYPERVAAGYVLVVVWR